MKTHHGVIGCLIALVSACSSGEEEPGKETEKPAKQVPITLNYAVAANTRVTDYGYESQDKIGLFVVKYNGETPGALQNTGNYVHNMRFTYNTEGLWKADTDIYWKDEQTKADFYCYFPHTASISSITAYSFAIKENQSTEQEYKKSEFLYGKTTGVSPTEKAVQITTNHLFSCAVITIQAGSGFTPDGLSKATISVRINGVQTAASIDLIKGTVTAGGVVKNIHPLKDANALSYKALIVPQSISADNLITVTIDGRDFNLKKDITFVGGKRYSIPVTVSKTSEGINVGVGAWENDNIDNGGAAE